MTTHIPFSLLDYTLVRANETARDALLQTTDHACMAEALGFTRYWLPEHHGGRAFASAATSVVLAHIAAHTHTLRLGAGGVMLPNHAPLVIAEQYGTLESLYPGRIDLGVGRSSGTLSDNVAKALRSSQETRDRFPADLRELQSLFGLPEPDQPVRAEPGAGLDVPIWVLASSAYSAQQAAQLGLPLAFASHIGAAVRDSAIAEYRSGFRPSAVLDRPYLMIATIVTAADTDAQAQRLFTTMQQISLELMRGNGWTDLPEPVADFDALANDEEREHVGGRLRAALTGSAQSIRTQLAAMLVETGADEIMAVPVIHDLAARRRSMEIFAQVCQSIPAP